MGKNRRTISYRPEVFEHLAALAKARGIPLARMLDHIACAELERNGVHVEPYQGRTPAPQPRIWCSRSAGPSLAARSCAIVRCDQVLLDRLERARVQIERDSGLTAGEADAARMLLDEALRERGIE